MRTQDASGADQTVTQSVYVTMIGIDKPPHHPSSSDQYFTVTLSNDRPTGYVQPASRLVMTGDLPDFERGALTRDNVPAGVTLPPDFSVTEVRRYEAYLKEREIGSEGLKIGTIKLLAADNTKFDPAAVPTISGDDWGSREDGYTPRFEIRTVSNPDGTTEYELWVRADADLSFEALLDQYGNFITHNGVTYRYQTIIVSVGGMNFEYRLYLSDAFDVTLNFEAVEASFMKEFYEIDRPALGFWVGGYDGSSRETPDGPPVHMRYVPFDPAQSKSLFAVDANGAWTVPHSTRQVSNQEYKKHFDDASGQFAALCGQVVKFDTVLNEGRGYYYITYSTPDDLPGFARLQHGQSATEYVEFFVTNGQSHGSDGYAEVAHRASITVTGRNDLPAPQNHAEDLSALLNSRLQLTEAMFTAPDPDWIIAENRHEAWTHIRFLDSAGAGPSVPGRRHAGDGEHGDSPR